MHARSRLVAVVTAMLVAFAFLAAVPGARASMSRPTWSTGDYWVYSFSVGVGTYKANGTFRLDVQGTESVTVNGTSYPTYHVAAVLTIPFGNLALTIPADIWYSTDTLAIVKVNAVLNLSLPGTNFTAGSTISIAGNPPQTIQWPLTAGASWSSTTLVWTKSTASNGTTTYGSASLTTVFNVQPDATITVPAGTFTTTPLKETPSGVSAGYVVVYWAPQAGNSARTETYNSTGHDQGGSNLTAYNYQASNFLFANYLGLQGYVWLIILAIVVVLIAAVVIMRRRRPRMPMTMPPQQPPMQPYEPPQGPPGTGP